jgi:L,D-peptidoglycan transpeptidase YkuD (ErfK/YbiS/YcfS/YnhG family)
VGAHPVGDRRGLSMFGSLLLLMACQLPGHAAESPLDGATQLVLVTTGGWEATAGVLRRYARDDGAWRHVGVPVEVTVGRNGTAWGTGLHDAQPGPQKREGDGKAPAGAFALGTAFGYADSLATGLPYRAMTASDWCIDVPASPLYNTIVDAREAGAAAIEGSTEPMRRDLHANGDQRYALGFVVEHNPGRTPGGGSCIFAHVWKAPGETTAGCTAMAEAAMRELLAWLDAKQAPVFVLLPEAELERLRSDWGLP